MFNRKKNSLQHILDNTPEGHMYVSDTLIAVPMEDGNCLAITGNFKGITAEEANLKIQNALTKMQ